LLFMPMLLVISTALSLHPLLLTTSIPYMRPCLYPSGHLETIPQEWVRHLCQRWSSKQKLASAFLAASLFRCPRGIMWVRCIRQGEEKGGACRRVSLRCSRDSIYRPRKTGSREGRWLLRTGMSHPDLAGRPPVRELGATTAKIVVAPNSQKRWLRLVNRGMPGGALEGSNSC